MQGEKIRTGLCIYENILLSVYPIICIFIDKNAIIIYEHCLIADDYLLLVTICYLIIIQQQKISVTGTSFAEKPY